MDIEIVPCSLEHIEKLIDGAEEFQSSYGWQVADDYMAFPEVLPSLRNDIQTAQIWHPWLPYLFIFPPDHALVGLGGFKTVPDPQRAVELGYSVAPSYQNRGVATSVVRQLIEIAFASNLVDCVYAYTLVEPNASARVLQKCGMTNNAEYVDDAGKRFWQWTIKKP